ncbi:MAG TPA: hypothetical protein VFN48_08750 [Solirubrobacteraceae bacterium]|nr:hypothetical protein [Solirubrobacteraceae bacterium]
MGQVISLTERLARRDAQPARSVRGAAAFFFALNCPLSYLVAEQVERDLGEIAWVPIYAPRDARWARERLHQAAALATTKRLPLIEPENFMADPLATTRAALHASQHQLGRPFALACMRLAFAGGYDVGEPDLIAEAAAHAGLDVEATVSASADAGLDGPLTSTAAALRRRGITEAPVIRIISGWFSGFDALTQTSAFAVARDDFAVRAVGPA